MGYDDILQELVGGSTSRSYTGGYGYSSSAGAAVQGVMIWTIIALILSLVGGILVYFLFVKNKNEPKGKFVKWLKEFLDFRSMWIESILKVTYYFLTIFTVLYSFTFLFAGAAGVLTFFFMLIGGPILVRIIYEASMMFIMIWRNTKDIADNTKKKTHNE